MKKLMKSLPMNYGRKSKLTKYFICFGFHRYFILYALIGWLYEYRSSNREQRSEDVQLAITYLIKYLQLCKDYGLVQSIPKEQDDENDKFRLHSTEDRQTKIQK